MGTIPGFTVCGFEDNAFLLLPLLVLADVKTDIAGEGEGTNAGTGGAGVWSDADWIEST